MARLVVLWKGTPVSEGPRKGKWECTDFIFKNIKVVHIFLVHTEIAYNLGHRI